MQNRRDFLKHAALLTGSVGMWGALEETIAKALAIEPEPGSSYQDAEHIVILMQENRSFDHTYGTLQGVRGFNDPRTISLPNDHPVWVQTNAAGESYSPFRLNLKDTKATWMGFLPHNWASQVDARNGGRYDHWLESKRSGHQEYAHMPLTMGFYNRQDIPFYYALADAFTVCDQHFCSSITPTLPNRVYFWTGTVREKQNADSPACVRNEQILNKNLRWTTFPERLEENGVSWKLYQNELSVKTGLGREEDRWLGNFGTNVLEYFERFQVKFAKRHREFLNKEARRIADEIETMKSQAGGEKLSPEEFVNQRERLDELEASLAQVEKEREKYSQENFDKLPAIERSLHEKAFCTNENDADFRQLVELAYTEGNTSHRVSVPKGDVLYQFREDVNNGKLPTVTWIAPPEKLSDHPESAWYGAWYVSEILKILTDNPEVWKKTIFILTYDENDGYFDHVPPFVAPRPGHPETGFISKSLDATTEYVELAADEKLKLRGPRQSPIGLGFRVPLVVASPWSRGGCVCSEVLDNVSVLKFLETYLTKKTGKPIEETNISSWRRAICGDLTSLFQGAPSNKEENPKYVARDPFVEQIFQAQFKPLPSGYKLLTKAEIEKIRQDPAKSDWMPRQEPGVRRSCPVPYELHVEGELSSDRKQFSIRLEAAKNLFGERTVGCPFTVYARGGNDKFTVRDYAVAAGDRLEDSWALADFARGNYHLQVYGPNGYFREFMGTADAPALEIRTVYSPNGNVELQVKNEGSGEVNVEIADRSYKTGNQKRAVAAGKTESFTIDTQKSHQWYDVAVTIAEAPKFVRRFAGHVETGKWSYSDPAMGGAVT